MWGLNHHSIQSEVLAHSPSRKGSIMAPALLGREPFRVVLETDQLQSVCVTLMLAAPGSLVSRAAVLHIVLHSKQLPGDGG